MKKKRYYGLIKKFFLQNSCKIDYLKNISDRVPKIFYFFRPIYATQLAIRFAVKQISGATEDQEISHIIQKNNDILGFFCTFTKFAQKCIQESGYWNHLRNTKKDYSWQ